MKINSNYAILINTCDKFDDCWEPFFKLWSYYWPNCTGQLYLNTEYKDFNFESLNIISLKVCERNHISRSKRVTWSQCLKWALEGIENDIVLYMQEDYFLRDNVKNDIVEEYVQLMLNNNEIKCIHLTDQAVQPSNEKSIYNQLDKVKIKQRYRVSCQAALWRKSELIELIRVKENAWEFEEFGSMRSALLRRNYYVVNKSIVQLNKFEIIPYVFTGIIQGRWFKDVIPLFQENNIYIDFSKRGFVHNAPQKKIMQRVSYRLNKIPKIIRNRIQLILLKKNIK